jgi:outer membrane protein OmpA-like peptidoglycan-associated protein
VKFRKGQAELAPASGALLAELAATLKGCDARIEVAVHAEPGSNAGVAQALTQRRADRIARRLVEHGVVIDRVVATGYGIRQPAGVHQRVEFRVLGAAT